MTRQQTHLDILLSRIVTHGDKPFFRSVSKNTQSGLTWGTKTYAEFGRDVETLATYLKATFQRDGISDNAVIGINLNGLTYSDIVHIYAVPRAGYVPNLLSCFLTDPEVVHELLSMTQSEALIHDPMLNLGSCSSNREYHRIDLNTLTPVSPGNTLPQSYGYDPDAVAFIQYTSGSTVDLPKVIRCTNGWFKSVYDSWNTSWTAPRDDEPQDVLNIPGPVSNPSGLHALLVGISFGAAFAESTSPVFSGDELMMLVSQCGLNRLNTFAPIFSLHIMETQKRLGMNDDSLYKALLNMRSIVYGGMPMIPDFENWAFKNRLPIMNTLGTTEAGPLLHCNIGENPQHLRPFPGLALQFILQPAEFSTDDVLYKLAVLPTSPNIPDVSLRDPDGNFYTGDLFSRNEDATWSHRGRDGDWINIQHAKLVDTKAVEDFVHVHCSDIVAELVVVGNGRPSLIILAEPFDMTYGQIAKDVIMERMASFNARRYAYERISEDQIVFVKKGTLPRTAAKGNVRRKAAEAKFKGEIDAVFA